ncbi:acyl-CoA dehydrogenase family protein [Nisaea acidiphila]|uniref:Acyl-CoA dehydrogenase family protein n=1 Tax=Nisaea acidiphila TaxID=1862145 RepID=A0A9J7ANM3_9PROT|nr:acyl-CoA dehydrogenase family protein [Nisaea acidiphila]UUX48538.1 acyl-CoA dehydrogenase family protein [Nisaea acidiphila]
MDFSLSEEQRMLKDTVERLVRETYDFEKRQKIAASEEGFSRDVWGQLAELGMLGVPFAEEFGGLGSGGVDLMILGEAMGRGLVVEPYLSTVVLGGGLIDLLGSAEQKESLLNAVVGGETLLAFAHGEPDSRYEPAHVRCKAEKTGGGWTLTGRKSVVLNGAAADQLIVSARISGGHDDEDGIGLFLVGKDAANLKVHGTPGIDGTHVAEIALDGVEVGADAVLGTPGACFAAIEEVMARAIVMLAGEAVGAMEVAVETTVEYLKTRKQFGKALSQFQVLQHRAVDMRISLEQAKSLAVLAAARLGEPRAVREMAISAAKAGIGQHARIVGELAIQLHGGIGMTWEVPVAHYAKRLVMIDHLFGDTDHHLERFAALSDAAA